MKKLKNKRRDQKDLQIDTDKVLKELDAVLKKAGFELEMHAIIDGKVKKIDSEKGEKK